MHTAAPFPQSLKGDADALTIGWSDGAVHRLRWKRLRDACPCATCRTQGDEPAKPAPLLAVLTAAEAQPLRGTAMKPVGNYAYAIQFTDGHDTGIFTFEHLRRLGEDSAGTT